MSYAIEELSSRLHTAARGATAIAQLTSEHPDMGVDDAYTIQAAVIGHRLHDGATRVGWKMGLTSRAKMEQVGVKEPIMGALTSDLRVDDGATIVRAEYIHPRAEPEIAFIIGREISTPCSPDEALAACSGVCASLEILDSRYRDFSFTLPDVIADNTSAAGFVLGPQIVPVAGLRLESLGIVLEINGAVRETASGGAVLDHPARSLAMLTAMLSRRGEKLREGDIVLSGGATAAIPLAPGDHVRARIEQLGSVEFFVA